MLRIGAALDLRFGKNTMQFIDFLSSNGLNHIEIRKDNDYVYGEMDPVKLNRVLSEYDFTISYHAPSNEFNIASVNERTRSACVSQIIGMGEYLHQVGSGWVNIHTGHVSLAYHEGVIAKAKENRTRSLDEIAAAYETLDTGLLIENDYPEKDLIKFGTDQGDIQGILDQYPGFGMTFDIGHAHLSNVPPVRFIKDMEHRINALHLHDNNGMHDEHLAPGKGSVEFVDVLKKIDGCCTYVLEMKAMPDIISGRDFIESLHIFSPDFFQHQY
ncbi:MAG: sugar phosphate isomerase/epimerase [Euryarchaeota archaeon]|nr:sugar phosphate isomerase/epimerase [Euryarchaeota archaeon]